MASDTWLAEYDACARLGQTLMENITERNKHSRTSSQYTKLSAHIRVSMKQFTQSLNKLKQNLVRASSSYHITQREVERRQMMMDNLTTKEKQIDQAFKNEASASRSSLMGGGASGFGGRDPWGVRDEPEEYEGMDNQGIAQQQQTIIQEQDRGLESLSKVISRQKQMAIDIGNEVDSQNDLIDDIGDHMDQTKTRLIKETRHIRIVDRKSATCAYWVAIILIFIAIIVILIVPYNGKGV
ncbi:syntaxin-8-like [Saccostrea echinata]|uniref:syntaxin-8-like n=1 Tax=Saccostrea echinata TaxID=191078 RepID=UPI002A839520|nr:syntaxin-8-like [Saccostrea echinata]